MLLEVVAHGVTAILATWLGLTVLVHAGRRPSARVFGFLALVLVTWSTTIVIERTTTDAAIRILLNAIEDLTAFLLPAATLHMALALAVEGRRTRTQDSVLIASYLLAVLCSVPAIVNPALEVAVTPPHFSLPGIPGEIFGWAWIAVRIAMFALALWWIAQALRQARSDPPRQRQLQFAFLTVGVGALGGVLRFLPGPADSDPWIGVSLVTIATVLAVYAVFAQGLFLTPQVAQRAFRQAVAVGLGVSLLVGLLVALEQVAQRALGIQLPIITGLALVAAMALFDPMAGRVRFLLGSADPAPSYDRLLRALGANILTAQRPNEAVGPALTRLSRIFHISDAAVIDRVGSVLAEHGHPRADDPPGLALPLASSGQEYGTLRFGAKRSGLPYTPREVDLLRLAATYIASSLRLAEHEDRQVEALDLLSAERQALETAGSALHEALSGGDQTAASLVRLHVFALGPMRVQRGSELVRQWGGEKAGTRQAEALFAFLFDRGERGVAKDEALELIWPDVDLERADLAFHRTLGGLRRTLEPERRRREGSAAIVFHNDRYRLSTDLVEWSDLAAFEQRMADAGAARTAEASLRALEEARHLYRGDYLDDCPFYGDSAHAEERRELLRARSVDLLLELGKRYAEDRKSVV